MTLSVAAEIPAASVVSVDRLPSALSNVQVFILKNEINFGRIVTQIVQTSNEYPTIIGKIKVYKPYDLYRVFNVKFIHSGLIGDGRKYDDPRMVISLKDEWSIPGINNIRYQAPLYLYSFVFKSLIENIGLIGKVKDFYYPELGNRIRSVLQDNQLGDRLPELLCSGLPDSTQVKAFMDISKQVYTISANVEGTGLYGRLDQRVKTGSYYRDVILPLHNIELNIYRVQEELISQFTSSADEIYRFFKVLMTSTSTSFDESILHQAMRNTNTIYPSLFYCSIPTSVFYITPELINFVSKKCMNNPRPQIVLNNPTQATNNLKLLIGVSPFTMNTIANMSRNISPYVIGEFLNTYLACAMNPSVNKMRIQINDTLYTDITQVIGLFIFQALCPPQYVTKRCRVAVNNLLAYILITDFCKPNMHASSNVFGPTIATYINTLAFNAVEQDLLVDVYNNRSALVNEAAAFLEHYCSRSPQVIKTSSSDPSYKLRASTITESSWANGKAYDDPTIFRVPPMLVPYTLSKGTGVIIPTDAISLQFNSFSDSVYFNYHTNKIERFLNLYIFGHVTSIDRSASMVAGKLRQVVTPYTYFIKQFFGGLYAHLMRFSLSPYSDASLMQDDEALVVVHDIYSNHIYSALSFVHRDVVGYPWVMPELLQEDKDIMLGLSLLVLLLKKFDLMLPLDAKSYSSSERVALIRNIFAGLPGVASKALDPWLNSYVMKQVKEIIQPSDLPFFTVMERAINQIIDPVNGLYGVKGAVTDCFYISPLSFTCNRSVNNIYTLYTNSFPNDGLNVIHTVTANELIEYSRMRDMYTLNPSFVLANTKLEKMLNDINGCNITVDDFVKNTYEKPKVIRVMYPTIVKFDILDNKNSSSFSDDLNPFNIDEFINIYFSNKYYEIKVNVLPMTSRYVDIDTAPFHTKINGISRQCIVTDSQVPFISDNLNSFFTTFNGKVQFREDPLVMAPRIVPTILQPLDQSLHGTPIID